MNLQEHFQKIFVEKDPFTDILGQDKVKNELKSALLMQRHVLIVGAPGIGKTTLAKNVAKILPEIEVVKGCNYNCDPKSPICPQCKSKKGHQKEKIKGEQRFVRVQGSPDLTPEDLLGDIDPVKALKFGPTSMEAFTPGKLFAANRGVLFFDEINRAPEKLQNALLQVLQEKEATIGSYKVNFPVDFILIATMNPEDTSTEKLSDVMLDRFDVIYMGYPEHIDVEKEIVKINGKKLAVDFPDDLLTLSISFVRLLRQDKNIDKKPSVRASIGLYERAQSNAYLSKRKKVTFEDIRESIISVISHRISLKPSIKYLESPVEYISREFGRFVSREAKQIKKEGEGP